MITVEKLTKSFGPKLAVDHLTFSVAKGEVLGFLGPNGAGKSTSMRMITGYLPPSDGKVAVCGFDVGVYSRWRLVGRLATSDQMPGVWPSLPELRGLFGVAKKQAIERVVELCVLERVLHQSVDTLSKGYRHRIGPGKHSFTTRTRTPWMSPRTAWIEIRNTKRRPRSSAWARIK